VSTGFYKAPGARFTVRKVFLLDKTTLDRGFVDSLPPEKTFPSGGTTEIGNGLLGFSPKIASKYFYDAKGSALFERITRLPEYYPTRTERSILVHDGPKIAHRLAEHLGGVDTVIEPGAGNCEKAAFLCDLLQPERYVGVDISGEFIHRAGAELRRACPGLDVQTVTGDITADISLPADLPASRRLVFYPGSSIGNFDPTEAVALMARMRRLAGDEGALLIGVDLVKDTGVLEAAYNDAAGVTAAFNLNILDHVNTLIGSDFRTRQWRHRAFFNRAQSRIEMHLEARSALKVRWPGAERVFAVGESIHTENSYKYRVGDFARLLAKAGFAHHEHWTDERGWFAVVLARP